MSFSLPSRAYDLEMLKRPADRGASDDQGWCFGLPPGIQPAQWPLDPVTGYPLMHGFTLLLPEDYRVHGPEIVGLSFFATSGEQNDGGADPVHAVKKLFDAPPAQPPGDPDLLFFWQSIQSRHPRLHRMSDILDYAYAAILLTDDEYHGPFCQPPQIPRNKYLAQSQPPEWLTIGSGASFARDFQHFNELLGGAPEKSLEYNRALKWTPRAVDMNAGKGPREIWEDEPTETGYRSYYYWQDGVVASDHFKEHDWAKGHKPNHIGGTMRPIQGVPDFSPYYIGFEEHLGGYNFGSGNAQLDFRDMKFDWAC